jgi:sigma-B regulation protein RsbU (phosphoserine phosphatase)
MRSAKAVGGDLYTFVHLEGERLGVMVGDVSGKGTPAALFMAKVVSEFKFLAREKTDPAQVLRDLNNSIASESTGGLFVTLSYAIFDMKERKLIMSNGGHLPLVSTDSEGGLHMLSADEGMPIGVMPDMPFAVSERPLKSGDCFMLYSDGISEARNVRKDEFGADALGKALIAVRHENSEKILNDTMVQLERFIGKAEQHDDMTLIVVKVTL